MTPKLTDTLAALTQPPAAQRDTNDLARMIGFPEPKEDA